MKENDVIWISIEESDKYELSNYGFVINNNPEKYNIVNHIDENTYNNAY